MSVIGRLVALGVGPQQNPGEAILWTRPSKPRQRYRTVAVDVGRYEEMGQQVALAAPQVLVLTHDDADHIDGWAGMVSFGLGTLEQLWVPYEWGALVLALEDFFQRADDDEADAASRMDALMSSATVLDSRESELENGAIDAEIAWRAHENAKSLAEELRVNDSLASRLGLHLKGLGRNPSQASDWRGTPAKVADRAVTRAVAITEIIAQALEADVKARYFSVDHLAPTLPRPFWEHSGIRGTLTIANAVEVRLDRTGLVGLLSVGFALYLTIQNSRALCPVLWGSDGRNPAVLIWSDSGGDWAHELSGLEKLFRKISISTAPHHGSTAPDHEPAWDALAVWRTREDLVVVLAGGEPSQKSANPRYFERCPLGRRGCTKCRHGAGRRRGQHNVVASIGTDGLVELNLGGCRR